MDFRHPAGAQDGPLLVGDALARGGDDAGVHDRPTHRQITQTLEVRVEPREQGRDGFGANQSFAKVPDRRLAGRIVAVVEAKEATKAAPVEHLELRLRVRKAVERLQDQRLEHHHRIQRRATALAAIGSLQGCIQRRPKYLEVDQSAQLLQRIAHRRQRTHPVGPALFGE